MGNIVIALHHYFLCQFIRIVDACPHHDIRASLMAVPFDDLRGDRDVVGFIRGLLDRLGDLRIQWNRLPPLVGAGDLGVVALRNRIVRLV